MLGQLGSHRLDSRVGWLSYWHASSLKPKVDRLDAIAAEEEAKRKGNMMSAYFPDTGPYRRELYPKHWAFFAAGAIHRERLFLAGDRIGKT